MSKANFRLEGRKTDELAREIQTGLDQSPRATPRIASGTLQTCAFAAIMLWGASEARPFLVPLCISALLAFLMAPLVRVMVRARIPEWLAVAASALLLALPLAAIGYMVFAQVQALSRDFPAIIRSLDDFIASFGRSEIGKRLHLANVVNVSTLADRLATSAGQGLQLLLTGLGALLNAGSQIALILLFAILMLASRNHLRKSGETILARHQNIHAALMLDEVANLIERFLIARMLIVIIVGLIDAGMCSAFGLKYSYLLGAFLGVMTLVPAVGFILAVIPPIIASLAFDHPGGYSGLRTLALGGALFAVSIIEGNVLTPGMVGRRLNINALFTFLGIFAGGLLWGLWGMFLSIPILGIFRIILSATPSLRPWSELLADKSREVKVASATPSTSRRSGHRHCS